MKFKDTTCNFSRPGFHAKWEYYFWFSKQIFHPKGPEIMVLVTYLFQECAAVRFIVYIVSFCFTLEIK